MADFALRPKAIQDLADIWFYTESNWGEAQADQYIRDLNDSFSRLAENPEKGMACDDIREGYRKCITGKHMVFYRQTSSGMEIVRILHQRMDPDQHL